MIVNCLERTKLPVYGNGGNVRDWLYVEDHARGLIAVASAGRVGGTYCIGGQTEKTNLDVVKSICALLDELEPNGTIGSYENLITFVEDRPGHDLRYAIDSTRISTELGWHPRETFETGLRKTVQWYLTHRRWWQRIRSGTYAGQRLGVLT